MNQIVSKLIAFCSKKSSKPSSDLTVSTSKSEGKDGNVPDSYFEKMGSMQDAISKRDYVLAARLARETLAQIPSLVRSTKQSYGSFDICSIPSLEVGGTMLALVGDDEGLAEMERIVMNNRELKPWIEKIDQHQKDRQLFTAIFDAVGQNPGCRQADMKSLVGTEDGRHVSTLIGWLDKAGKITREKKGKTYLLWPAGAAGAPTPLPKRKVCSHRKDYKSPRLREIDVASIPYVPLPRSPLRWEEAQARTVASERPVTANHFQVLDANGWELGPIEKIPPQEKPDTAFRQFHPVDSGLFMVDDLGNAEGLGQIPAAVIHYGRSGELLSKQPLFHDIYRINVNPMGRGLIAMSKECIVHAYDDALSLLFETTLKNAPEIQAICKRLGIDHDQLRNHIRCVALSRDSQRYLFTVVDEAWCVSVDGKALWGIKLPIKDGWTRIAEASSTFGTSGEIQNALALMGMTYPFTQGDIKSRYRQLAKEWHPDVNRGDPTKLEQMKALNSAVQLLTGISENSLPAYTGVQYSREIDRHEIEMGGLSLTLTTSCVVGEIHVSDWIYAASFAGWSDRVFLAGYSGRVIVLNESGEPERAYDIGAVPRRIIDIGDYLYILTDTRLYVLRGDVLYAIIDTFDGGDVIVAHTGFGLLEKNRFRWYREDGVYLGSVVTKAPIRRVYSAPGGITVETRTHRTFVRGGPVWWEDGR